MASIQPTSKTPLISTSRLRDYTFFTDRDSGGDFHGALVAAGLSVERHDDHFNPWKIVEDHEWIALCASKGWIGVTSDRRIRGNPLAQRAILGRRIRPAQSRTQVCTRLAQVCTQVRTRPRRPVRSRGNFVRSAHTLSSFPARRLGHADEDLLGLARRQDRELGAVDPLTGRHSCPIAAGWHGDLQTAACLRQPPV